MPGVGPIPVSVAREWAEDSFLKAVLVDGTDVKAVSHMGRTIPARLRTALEARDPTCVVPGCDVRQGLEIDHVVPFASGGPTSLRFAFRPPDRARCATSRHEHDLAVGAGFEDGLVGPGRLG